MRAGAFVLAVLFGLTGGAVGLGSALVPLLVELPARLKGLADEIGTVEKALRAREAALTEGALAIKQPDEEQEKLQGDLRKKVLLSALQFDDLRDVFLHHARRLEQSTDERERHHAALLRAVIDRLTRREDVGARYKRLAGHLQSWTFADLDAVKAGVAESERIQEIVKEALAVLGVEERGKAEAEFVTEVEARARWLATGQRVVRRETEALRDAVKQNPDLLSRDQLRQAEALAARQEELLLDALKLARLLEAADNRHPSALFQPTLDALGEAARLLKKGEPRAAWRAQSEAADGLDEFGTRFRFSRWR